MFQEISNGVLYIAAADCDIVGGKNGIHFTYVRDGRPSGEAYIELRSEDDVQQALTKDKQTMGKRYIEGNAYSLVQDQNAVVYRLVSGVMKPNLLLPGFLKGLKKS